MAVNLLERVKGFSTAGKAGLACLVVAALVAVAGCVCLCGVVGLALAWPEEGFAPLETALAPAVQATEEPVSLVPTFTPAPLAEQPPSGTPLPATTLQPGATVQPGATLQSPTTVQQTPTPASPGAPQAIGNRTWAEVVSVTDGDTIRVSIDGVEYAVRYIGIDAPEMHDPLGSRAKQANKKLVAGRIVYLEKDVSETDQYDRLLRYVYLEDETFVNRKLVRQGWAAAKEYPPDTKQAASLAQAEQAARDAQRGIWAGGP